MEQNTQTAPQKAAPRTRCKPTSRRRPLFGRAEGTNDSVGQRRNRELGERRAVENTEGKSRHWPTLISDGRPARPAPGWKPRGRTGWSRGSVVLLAEVLTCPSLDRWCEHLSAFAPGAGQEGGLRKGEPEAPPSLSHPLLCSPPHDTSAPVQGGLADE